MKRISAASLVLLIAAATGWVAAEDALDKVNDEKVFRVESKSIDLGTVQAGSDGIAVFEFHNGTDKDVKIIRAKPT